MEHELVSHATFVVERVYPDSPPARVFAAYADREAKARWSTGPKHWRPELELDFRVGGWERYRGGPPDDSVHAVDAWYLDIEPDRRIVYAYDVRVGDTRLVASLATVELRPEGGRHAAGVYRAGRLFRRRRHHDVRPAHAQRAGIAGGRAGACPGLVTGA